MTRRMIGAGIAGVVLTAATWVAATNGAKAVGAPQGGCPPQGGWQLVLASNPVYMGVDQQGNNDGFVCQKAFVPASGDHSDNATVFPHNIIIDNSHPR